MGNIIIVLLRYISNICFGIKQSYLASKKFFMLKCTTLIMKTVIPLINIWLWKIILNGISDRFQNIEKIFMCLIAYLSLMLFNYLISVTDNYIDNRYQDELQLYMNIVLIEKVSRIDLGFFDSASMEDKVSRVRGNFYTVSNVTWTLFDVISEVISIITIFIIVSSYKWWMGLVSILFIMPLIIHNIKHTKLCFRLEKEQERDNRMMEYYHNVFLDNDVQFEIKTNGIGSYFLSRYNDIWKKLNNINMKTEARHCIVNTLCQILNSLSSVVILVVSVIDVIKNNIGIGDLQYNFSMVTRLCDQINAFMNDVNQLIVNNSMFHEIKEFIEMKTEIEKSGTKHPSQNPKIEFRNVYFKYPNTEEYVLKDCSFIINSNEKVGFVGVNGSGKSTIIKLMFRFYDPQAGAILLDNIDIREYNIYEVRKIFGVLFQDYVTYSLPLREIIALSDFRERFNDEKLKKACDISGVSPIIKNWEMGFDSVLGRYYADNAKDLSGGQWQLVSLARAYFKECKYMILDEPSAALDPIAEDRIFEQLYHLSKGKSSITISHRLSNTTLSDKIFVIHNGHIIEQGSHSDLLKQNGRYAKMFHLQANKYE